MSNFRFPADLWAGLEKTAAAASTKMARRTLYAVGDVTVFARYSASSSQKEIGFELPRRLGLDGTQFARSKGIELRIERAKDAWKKEMKADYLYASLRFGDETMFEAFACNIVDLIAKIGDVDGLVRKLKGRIEDWQEMFSRPKGKAPEINEMVGMYGELTILRDFMIPTLGIDAAVKAWMGPVANAKDFQHAGHALEVKTTRNPAADRVTIANYRQLDMEEHDSLTLALLTIKEDPGNGDSLLELYERLCAMMAGSEESLKRFCGMMAGAGWTDESLLFSPADIRFSVDRTEFFAVEGTFPRYTKEHIVAGTIPKAYDIAMNACRPYSRRMQDIIERMQETKSGRN